MPAKHVRFFSRTGEAGTFIETSEPATLTLLGIGIAGMAGYPCRGAGNIRKFPKTLLTYAVGCVAMERYRLVDFALKVVGVGSVGTRCYILLLDSSHCEDPLFLQLKESQASVLEPLLGRSPFANHGQRVVNGQRMMQSASDMFLGWTSEGGHDYCVRQLRDMKGAADLENMNASALIDYARLCGWVLARAHARSGDSALIAGYLGQNEVFDQAVANFAEAYADQTLHDYDNFQAAVKAGRIPVELGV